MQISHLGHSCVVVEAAGTRLLIDPGNLSANWQTIPPVDAVLVTHAHADHGDPIELPRYLAAHPTTAIAVEAGVHKAMDLPARATTIEPGDEFDSGALHVRAVGGRHAIIHPDIPVVGNVGLIVSAPGEPTVFHPGDSLATTPEDIDIVLIPVMGPWSATRETIDFTRAVGAKRGFLIHEGLLNERGYALIAGHLTRLTSTQLVDVRDSRPWRL